MEKRQIILLSLIGVIVLSITIGFMYYFSNNNQKNEIVKEMKVGNYTLKYGKYKGIVEEYNPDTETMDKQTVYIEITDTMIKNESSSLTYSIKDNMLVTGSGLQYEIIDNNKLLLLAGGGVEYEYSGEN